MKNEDLTNKSVEFDGHCAFALSIGKLEVMGTDSRLTVNNKTYVFSNPVAKFLFRILPNRVEKAEANWKNK